ncbi:MAG: glycosyltransferase [Chloroflexi bacterium]|nr:glycosyltransferase [Chloroflexota bacterium]
MGTVKVLQIVDQLGGGGAERVVVDIATHLPSGYEPLVCVTRARGSLAYAPKLKERNVPFVPVGRRWRYDVVGLMQLRRLVSDFRPDIVHTHLAGSNAIGRLLRLSAHIPVLISHEHTWAYDPRDRVRILANRLLSPLSDAIVAVSGADRRQLIKVEHLPPHKISVIYNGVDFSRVDNHVPSAIYRQTLGIDERTFLAAIVGKLEFQKGHDVLLESLTKVVTRLPSFKLLVLGEGSLRVELEAKTSELNLHDHVVFMGFADDVGSVLSCVDLVVMPSHFEGHPLALLEAMAAGRTVIATDVGGVPEVIRPGETGILIPPGSPDALASSILDVASAPDMAAKLGRAAAADVRARFSIQAAMAQYLALYERLLSTNGRASIALP